MKLDICFYRKGLADGDYSVTAGGCNAALLFWADGEGPLKDWLPFACMPLDAFGKGRFRFRGGRGIPPEAECICVRTVSEDLKSVSEELFPIPAENRSRVSGEALSLAVMSDLHLSVRSGLLARAFSATDFSAAVLLTGDMTNDGTETQFEELRRCLDRTAPGKPVLPVAGNHDVPLTQPGGTGNYLRFQEQIFRRLRQEKGISFSAGPDGAYMVRIRNTEIIGLQAVAEGRKFLFEEGKQLEWLEELLKESGSGRRQIILCHAPLIHHNLRKSGDTGNSYLNRDRQLQKILDFRGNIIFISGHTHLSPDNPEGCVEWDEQTGNLYIDAGSIRPTELLPGESMQLSEWKNGVWIELRLGDAGTEIIVRSVKDGKKHARGYYRKGT